ncbi:hypothetical protein [Kordiimonas sp. SCSIO 12610]|uniref:hypothetical protein n=1 Tax=Kordiimonas sp. SCSIO 12610 TaxID=2829597 RepID=UPI00210E4E61|nr:hypothetical protein [Kordiimonas sp. SCSIO 12610]UTW56100.1 hypothetical protein KFF44_04180 [Kordiimonas sp. SCSIO 12610]
MLNDYKSQLFSEIQTMLKYLAKTGKSIPTEVSVLLKTLDIPNADNARPATEASNIGTDNLLSLHNTLGDLCKPATPMSIDASSTLNNKTVMISSLVGFVGFLMIMFANIFGPAPCTNVTTCTNLETCAKIATCTKQEKPEAPPSPQGTLSSGEIEAQEKPETPASPQGTLSSGKTEAQKTPVATAKQDFSTNILISSLGGAFLGSAFYALYSASQYIKAQTFDPGYTQVYLIRLILGIFAGYLLANIIIPNSGDNFGETGIIKYGPELLGVIGGFSAEAVIQILQRFSDTLVTIVKGSDKEKVKSEVKKAVTKTTTETSSKLNGILAKDDATEMKDDIKQIIKDLS